ncbi:MAG: lysoplasmalogenase [Lachnospiraceae bacterium]|nr:lysoplasmalogenase [Lachnospiraceae bacterium]
MIPAIVYLISLLGLILQAVFVYTENKKDYLKAVIFKGSASLMFVLIGILGYRAALDISYAKMVLAGLCLGALGDILLNLRFLFQRNGQKVFLLGIAAFFAGHIMYLLALIPFSSHLLISVPIGVVCAALLLTYIFRKLSVKPAFKIFGIFYLGAIIVMTSIAIECFITETTFPRFLFAFGAVLFTISDIVLIFNTFGDKTTLPRRITNLFCYYVAQLLIAYTIFLI